MRRPEFIARQSGHPRGLLGRLLVAIMRRETARENDRALALLDIGHGDAILEIGFGHGRTLHRAAELAGSFVAGVDVSAAAIATAERKLRRLIQRGRVELRQADSSHIPYPDARFDRALAIHTLYFWPDPHADLREIWRVLRPGGRFVLGFRRAEDAGVVSNFPSSVYRFYCMRDVAALLERSGFVEVDMRVEHVSAAPIVYALAHRPLPRSG